MELFVAVGIVLGLIWLLVVSPSFRIAVAIFVGLVTLAIVGFNINLQFDHNRQLTAVCERIAHGDYSDGLSWEITNRPGFWAAPDPIRSSGWVLVCQIANPSNWREEENKLAPIDCNDGNRLNSLFPECQKP